MAGTVRRPAEILYYHHSTQALAEQVAKKCQEMSESQPLECVQQVELRDTVMWKTFPDGWPNLFIENVKQDCAGRDVIFLGSFHSPSVVFEQLSIIYNIPRYLARSFTIILPYFPTGTMERVDTEGQVATAKTLATLLSAIPMTARGPAQIVIFDIHALQERFYFSDQVIPRLESAIPLLLREISRTRCRNVSIAFPDEGAFKRFHPMFKKFPTIICSKKRVDDKRIVRVKDGDPKDHHVIIVDDLVMTGGTLIECGKALLSCGASKISAYTTHGVFPQNSWQKFLHKNCPVKFEKFYMTDSIPMASEICKNPPFYMLSLCDAIADVLLGFDLLQN